MKTILKSGSDSDGTGETAGERLGEMVSGIVLIAENGVRRANCARGVDRL